MLIENGYEFLQSYTTVNFLPFQVSHEGVEVGGGDDLTIKNSLSAGLC